MNTLFIQVLQWWVPLFFLGLVALPFVTRFFSVFFDKGYAFSKTVGIITLSYLAFVAGTIHVLLFSVVSLLVLFGILSIVSFLFAKKQKRIQVIKSHWRIFLFEEVLFFVGLLFWSYIKSFQPDIHGLEKFMDYGFINSILRSTYFPPKDMWMPPLFINYYYFGHLTTAVLTKLSFLPSYISFNLMLATLFASTFLGGFSLGGNFIYLFKEKKIRLLKVIIAGLLTAFLLTLSGNLHTIYTFFTPYKNEMPLPPTQLQFAPNSFPNQYWYPNATRFIYHTIHEFPIYSFVVSDLHGHVLDIPAVLFMLAVLFVFFLKPAILNTKELITQSILLGSLSAIMYMTNAWDGLIYFGVSALLLFYKTIATKRGLAILSAFLSFIIVGLPFSLFFKPFASQLGINCAPDFLTRLGNIGPILFEKGYCQYSPLWQLAILYGFFFFWLLSLLSFLYVQLKKQNTDRSPIDLFVIGLGLLGTALIIIPEFVYLKDIYTTYFRANTMFKLVYQSFILLSLVSAYAIIRILNFKFQISNFPKRILALSYMLFAICLLTLVSIYPYFAVTSYFGLTDMKGLNGIKYLQNINRDDYNAILWLNRHIQGQPVVLEAQGDSYTDYERVSANTGLPTVFGWMVHEWLWRGTYDIVPERVADVKTLYESQDIDETVKLLKKYKVMFVYIGDMERSKYPKLQEAKFGQLGKVVYQKNSVKIYRIHI